MAVEVDDRVRVSTGKVVRDGVRVLVSVGAEVVDVDPMVLVVPVE